MKHEALSTHEQRAATMFVARAVLGAQAEGQVPR